MLRALRVRDFRLLWTARLSATLAAGLLVVAVPAHVYAVTGSVLVTGFTLAVEYLPVLLLGPFAGVLADRWDRRRLMTGTDLARAAAVCLIVFARTPDTVGLIYLAVLAEGTAAVLFRPAAQAHTPAVVGTGSTLAAANAANAVASGVIGLGAAPLGAALFSAFGIGAVVTVAAVGYLVSAVTIASTRPHPRGRHSHRRPLDELRDGLRHLHRSAATRALMITGGLYLAANAALTALLVPFAATFLGDGTQVGWMLSALSAGFLLGAPVSRRIVDRFPARTTITGGQVLVAIAFFMMFNARSLPMALTAALLLGVPGVTVLVALQTWLQRVSPPALLGRVSAAFLTAEAAATMAGAFAGPALGELAGLPLALNVACALTLGAAAAAFLLVPASPAAAT
ncbi:MFS transporter [Planobispora longispora]|uniref:MFS transporter n=1 Tax=Planobispora longispora TaxID=28887 RepID=A0A8J3RRC1_9ACTN|nr:MFS transporter [Planobispora longispora]GIH79360.1 MFS transporter [Planobispora longispora]